MVKSEWNFGSAVKLSAALTAKKVSSVELTQHTINSIEQHDGKDQCDLRARFRSSACCRARSGCHALARREEVTLGLPLTVKESFNIAGLPTTWGYIPQKAFKPAEDALAIARVKEAGG
ncbi:amidase family protein [Bradyrhizobium icense]|uniref:amidase family protein n=1 Tax=Bradyrhizobium icense TaxID=1274631 RepID=UPI001EEDBA4B|nr:amidase family protein [Bradyrhizobium icense]